jgi:hypothetical protein
VSRRPLIWFKAAEVACSFTRLRPRIRFGRSTTTYRWPALDRRTFELGRAHAVEPFLLRADGTAGSADRPGGPDGRRSGFHANSLRSTAPVLFEEPSGRAFAYHPNGRGGSYELQPDCGCGRRGVGR